jgi:outer membrane murein-binding lipoprotein Lpp
MNRHVLIFAVALIFLAGCVSVARIDDAMYDQYLTKTYDYSMDRTFNATIAALKDFKIGIEKQDRANGIIVTQRAVFYEGAVGGQGYAHRVNHEHKYYFKITGTANSATVKATKYRIWQNNVERMEINPQWCAENLWNPLFREIQNKLEGM